MNTTTSKLPSAAALRDILTAINFALDRLEPFEVAAFLAEWREGKDLAPWLGGVQYDEQFAASLSLTV